jgi:hypothetical protein
MREEAKLFAKLNQDRLLIRFRGTYEVCSVRLHFANLAFTRSQRDISITLVPTGGSVIFAPGDYPAV